MSIGLFRLIARAFFREIVISGRENLPPEGCPVIIVANHPNALLDPLLLMFLSPPVRLRFIAKEPLFRIPVLGAILRKLRAIPVIRRFDVRGEVEYTPFFHACVDALAEGDSVVIFPEGRSLPLPSIAPLRTGAARIYLLARKRDIRCRLIPVGLNYERGAIFRSSVLMSIAPPVPADSFEQHSAADPVSAVRGLTAEISRSLEDNLFQAETFQDRELLLLLERLYSREETDRSWLQRYSRLKKFQSGLAGLRKCCPLDIERMRRRLARYRCISDAFNLEEDIGGSGKAGGVWKRTLLASIGTIIAGIGALLNWIPYRLDGYLIRITGRTEADAATYKILYALLLFPLIYILEGFLVAYFLGWKAGVLFGLLILPLSWFTLLLLEWRTQFGIEVKPPSAWFRVRRSRRAQRALNRLRDTIIREVDSLAARPELRDQ